MKAQKDEESEFATKKNLDLPGIDEAQEEGDYLENDLTKPSRADADSEEEEDEEATFNQILNLFLKKFGHITLV